jgi:hypothetical protein
MRRPLSTRARLTLARVFIFLIGVFLLIWSLWYPLGQNLWDYMAISGAIYFIGAFVLLVGGIYWKRASRVGAYLALLTDDYPSTEDEQAIHLEIDYPDVKQDLNRWLPLVKWFLAIPHFVVLFFLVIGAFFAVVIAWFAILFTGRYPRGLFDYVVGVSRWALRVEAYAVLMVTDRYPPFSLS